MVDFQEIFFWNIWCLLNLFTIMVSILFIQSQTNLWKFSLRKISTIEIYCNLFPIKGYTKHLLCIVGKWCLGLGRTSLELLNGKNLEMQAPALETPYWNTVYKVGIIWFLVTLFQEWSRECFEQVQSWADKLLALRGWIELFLGHRAN